MKGLQVHHVNRRTMKGSKFNTKIPREEETIKR